MLNNPVVASRRFFLAGPGNQGGSREVGGALFWSFLEVSLALSQTATDVHTGHQEEDELEGEDLAQDLETLETSKLTLHQSQSD